MSVVDAQVDAIRAAGGRRIKGPTALTGDTGRAINLTWALAYLEFRLKFFGSVLGYLWQLGRPLLMFAVMYVVFVKVLKQGAGVAYYASTLLMGIMVYQFFGECTGGAVSSVLDRENLVRKIHFPRIVIPLSVVVASSLTLAVNAVAVGFFMVIQGVPVRVSWLGVLPALALLLVTVLGLSMLLSALFVRYRDVRPIWDVTLQAAFYATPILYPIELVPESFRAVLMASPLATVIQQIRHSVFDPSAPTPAEALGSAWLLAVPIGIGVGLLVLGFWVFNRTAPVVAEEL
ncbi:MAG: ABC transporter permease [Solirubrobacteraceae bacterium]